MNWQPDWWISNQHFHFQSFKIDHQVVNKGWSLIKNWQLLWSISNQHFHFQFSVIIIGSTMAWSLQKMVLLYRYFKLKWRFKVSKTSIFNEIQEIFPVKYSKQSKKLVQISFALYLSVKLAQKSNSFSHILCYGGLGTPRIYVFIV